MKFQVVEKVADLIRQHHRIVDVDGVRVPFEKGWGLVRASNTQPVLVMRFEAASKDLLKKYRQEIEAVVQQAREEVSSASSRE